MTEDIQLEETNVVTEDMKLPPGSAVIQCILHTNEDGNGGFLDVRAVTIGSNILDMANPAHRFIAAVSERMEELLTQVGETAGFEEIPAAEAETRLRAVLAANETIAPPQPGEHLRMSDGSTLEVADEGEYPRGVLADAQHKHNTAS
jgi:hypothetical protein